MYSMKKQTKNKNENKKMNIDFSSVRNPCIVAYGDCPYRTFLRMLLCMLFSAQNYIFNDWLGPCLDLSNVSNPYIGIYMQVIMYRCMPLNDQNYMLTYLVRTMSKQFFLNNEYKTYVFECQWL